MHFEVLTEENVEKYLAFLRQAVAEEPDLMFIDTVDEEALRKRVADPFFQQTTNILAIEDENVLGRIEYHFYGCLQDGYRMAYVDWVYVSPKARHKGIAQALFAYMEEDCKAHNIDQYYLIRATNPGADKFYHSFKNVELLDYPVLTKNIGEKT